MDIKVLIATSLLVIFTGSAIVSAQQDTNVPGAVPQTQDISSTEAKPESAMGTTSSPEPESLTAKHMAGERKREEMKAMKAMKRHKKEMKSLLWLSSAEKMRRATEDLMNKLDLSLEQQTFARNALEKLLSDSKDDHSKLQELREQKRKGQYQRKLIQAVMENNQDMLRDVPRKMGKLSVDMERTKARLASRWGRAVAKIVSQLDESQKQELSKLIYRTEDKTMMMKRLRDMQKERKDSLINDQ